ncbi:MAG: carboxypeptidase regulatory-like domain-containing protein [Bryobacteraceae bacterium]
MPARLVLSALILATVIPAAERHTVTGTVLDPAKTPIPAAKVAIQGGGTPRREVQTNADGSFRIPDVPQGRGRIEVTAPGFKALTREISIPAPQALRFELSVADLQQEITVTGETLQASVEPAENLDVVQIDAEDLETLPVLGNDILGGLTDLMDPGLVGADGPDLVVDGMPTTEVGVSPSAIREVRINRNPYSAEFLRPGRGRIEISTREPDRALHGTLRTVFRDSRVDARNAFAATRPKEQRRSYEGYLTGPLPRMEKTFFLLSFEREEEDLQSLIYARTPDGIVQAQEPLPQRETELSVRILHRASDRNSYSLQYERSRESALGSSIGGFTLRESGADERERAHRLQFSHQGIFGSGLMSQTRIRTRTENEETQSRLPGVRRIEVLDAFTSGGAQADGYSSEARIEAAHLISWSRGKHFVKTGINVNELGRQRFDDRSNLEGAYSFSSLENYVLGRPFTFTRLSGPGTVAFWNAEIGGFIQDDIRLRPNLSLGVGFRYDRQSYPSDRNNFAPRFSLAYAPKSSARTVFRGGAGFFYDQMGMGSVRDTLLLDGLRRYQIVITNPSYPDPVDGDISVVPPSIVRFASDLRSPLLLQYSFGVERQLLKKAAISVNWTGIQGRKLFRSRDLNAPVASDGLRPDPAAGIVQQIESSAGMKTNSLEVSLRGELSRFFNGRISYRRGVAYNDTNGEDSLPANNYDLSGEWGRASYDRRHRFHLLGTVKPGDFFRLGVSLSLYSGAPYTLTTGRDDNRDGVARDRPAGIGRNTLQGPGSATLDLRWSRDFTLPLQRDSKNRPRASLSFDAFNVLNRVNYSGFVGNLSSPFFGRAVSSRPARRLQVGLRFSF